MSTYDPNQHQQRMDSSPSGQYNYRSAGWPQQPPQAPPKHRRGRGVLIAVFAVVVIAAAGSTAWALGGHSGTAAAPTCHQQYLAWKNGPGATAFKNTLNADSDALNAAGNSEDIPAMIAALKKFGADAATVRREYPVPACADPAGYYSQMLADMTAAGDNAGTASGFSAVMVAMAPLQNIKPLGLKLKAELARTAGYKG